MREKIIDFLLSNADPSVVLRARRELLNGISKTKEDELLQKIRIQKNIQSILQAQKPDGWIGNYFHGQSKKFGAGMYDNMEVGLRYLAEKGFPADNEYITKAVHSFLVDGANCSEFRLHAPPDDYAHTAFGVYLLRSSVILRAGHEYLLPTNDYIDLHHDVVFSFRTFLNVLNFADADGAVDTSKRQLCFKPGVLWPCSYDLRILAHSQGWRSHRNISLLADSMNRLFSFRHVREKMIYTYIKGQFRAPCLAFIHSGMYNLGMLDDAYVNFDLLELFARCGVVKQVPFLQNKYEYVLSLVDDDLDVDYKIASGERNWGPYGGFALEEDWKSKTRKQCDALFRILMIMHYVNLP